MTYVKTLEHNMDTWEFVVIIFQSSTLDSVYANYVNQIHGMLISQICWMQFNIVRKSAIDHKFITPKSKLLGLFKLLIWMCVKCSRGLC